MKKSFAYPYGVWLAVFILAPILMVVVYAFHNADGGFTLHNFSYLPGYLPIFGRSFWLAFLSTAVCLVLGYPMAYLMSRLSASKQSLCMMLIMLPMWINFLLRTYAWMSILENNGFINQFFRSIGLISFLQSHFGYSLDYIPLINTQGAIVLGMVYNFLPFMVLPIYTVLIKLDRKLIEAAQDLGAPTHLVFRRVIFPLSIPGVISGITMVFVPALSSSRCFKNEAVRVHVRYFADARQRQESARRRPDRPAVHGRCVQPAPRLGDRARHDHPHLYLHVDHEQVR